MNKKDYKAIAEIINNCSSASGDLNIRKSLANDLVDYFEERLHVDFIADDYNRFDKKQFLKDCGVKE